MKEEEQTMLFATVESIVQDVISTYMIVDVDSYEIKDSEATAELKQKCINMIAFGESLEESS